MKAYVTKYALTKGIVEVEDAQPSYNGDKWVEVPSRGYTSLFCKDRDIFYSYDKACENVLKRVKAKRKSIDKQLTKLEELEATYNIPF